MPEQNYDGALDRAYQLAAQLQETLRSITNSAPQSMDTNDNMLYHALVQIAALPQNAVASDIAKAALANTQPSPFNEQQLRMACLSQNMSERFKKLMITDAQRAILMHIGRGTVSANQAKILLNCALESASARLKVLFDKGYLERVCVQQPSGGVEYVYSCTPLVKLCLFGDL